jgi:hypothetical protein
MGNIGQILRKDLALVGNDVILCVLDEEIFTCISH